MNNEELYKYRIDLIRKSIAFEKTDRIAHISNAWLWKVHDAGLTISEAFGDTANMEKAVVNHQETYNFDMLIDYGSRGPSALYTFLEGDTFVVDEEKGYLSIKDDPIFELEEYDEMLADMNKFFWEKALPRKFKKLQGPLTKEDFMTMIGLYSASGGYMMSIPEKMKNEYGLPSIPMMAAALASIEILCGGRGIKGLSTDMRRGKDKVAKAVELFDQFFADPIAGMLMASPDGPDMNNPIDTMCVLISHAFMNKKHWEAYYWPHLKKFIDICVRKKKQIYLFCEASMIRFAEYFEDIPKGVVALHLENDDIYEVRKRLPNICLIGGMTSALLGNGTPQECVDGAKKLIDEIGRDGGFILSQNKMLSYKEDCIRENLKAVSEFVLNYQM